MKYLTLTLLLLSTPAFANIIDDLKTDSDIVIVYSNTGISPVKSFDDLVKSARAKYWDNANDDLEDKNVNQ